MKSINNMIKSKPESNENVNAVNCSNQKPVKIEEKDNKDYISVHKMMVELSVNFQIIFRKSKRKIAPLVLSKTMRI